MPFKSQSQRKWMHANKPEMAKEWEAHTPKGKLPEKVAAVLVTDSLTTRGLSHLVSCLEKDAFQVSMYSGPLGWGSFPQASYIPPFRSQMKTSGPPSEKTSGPPSEKVKKAYAQVAYVREAVVHLALLQKQASVPTVTSTTPSGRLAQTMRVGLPRVTSPSGPSIAEQAKPKGYGKPLPGATKTAMDKEALIGRLGRVALTPIPHTPKGVIPRFDRPKLDAIEQGIYGRYKKVYTDPVEGFLRPRIAKIPGDNRFARGTRAYLDWSARLLADDPITATGATALSALGAAGHLGPFGRFTATPGFTEAAYVGKEGVNALLDKYVIGREPTMSPLAHEAYDVLKAKALAAKNVGSGAADYVAKVTGVRPIS